MVNIRAKKCSNMANTRAKKCSVVKRIRIKSDLLPPLLKNSASTKCVVGIIVLRFAAFN